MYSLSNYLNDIFFNTEEELFYRQAEKSFPPADIITDKDYSFLEIVLSVAGYLRENISISVDGEYLTIEGKMKTDERKDLRFLINGLKTTAFKKHYRVDSSHFDLSQINCNLANGCLVINIPKLVNSNKKLLTIG